MDGSRQAFVVGVGWPTWCDLIGRIAAQFRTTSHQQLAREDKAKPERTAEGDLSALAD